MHDATANAREDVGKIAPEAGHLLTAAFPALTLEEANAILTETQGPGGGFLDDGSEIWGVFPDQPLRGGRQGRGAGGEPGGGERRALTGDDPT